MIVETVNKNKNNVTIIAFVLVCILLNIENIAHIFHFSIPQFFRTYAVYFPFLFVLVVFTQKKSNRTEITDEILWETKRKNALQLNNVKTIIRYTIIAGVGIFFLLANMYETRSGFNSQNGSILIGLIIAIIVTLLYNHYKKGFQIGFCGKGILYGYPHKVMLIKWELISDFELIEPKKTILIYCKSGIVIQKITLTNSEHFQSLLTLVKDRLTYKNVTKLLTDD